MSNQVKIKLDKKYSRYPQNKHTYLISLNIRYFRKKIMALKKSAMGIIITSTFKNILSPQ